MSLAGSPPRRVFLEAFGCQMNYLDGEFAMGSLKEQGWVPARSADEADLVVFNTCSVRSRSEDKVWSRLGVLARRKQRDPGLLVAVMGCMAQREGEEILRRAPVVDVVVGTRRYADLARLVREAEDTGRRFVSVATAGFKEPARDVAVRSERHRGWVAVMRGCSHVCAYCIVPATRGRQFDRDEASIVDEVRRLVDDGVTEVFLLGQNINTWGRTLPGRPTLAALLHRVHDVAGVRRIRFLTSNPMDLEIDLLDAMGSLPRVMPYLHFPAQSGSDAVLRRMHRGYTRARYLELVDEARSRVRGIQLATDLIVGFPGETEEDFLGTLSLIEAVRWQQAFIFKYSPRPGTKAAEEYSDDVPEDVKKDRNRRALLAQDREGRRILDAQVGTEVEVLLDGPSERDPGTLQGRTPESRLAILPGGAGLAGDYVRGRVRSATVRALYVDPLPVGVPS